MIVSERLRSCWGPSRLDHNGDPQSSQLQLHRAFFEWTTKSLLYALSNALTGRPLSQGSRVLRFCHFELEQSSCSSKFGCSSFMKHTPQAVCSLIVMRKNLTTIRSDFIEYFTFHFVNYCRLWSLMVFELWWFVIFDSFSLVQPIRLFEPL